MTQEENTRVVSSLPQGERGHWVTEEEIFYLADLLQQATGFPDEDMPRYLAWIHEGLALNGPVKLQGRLRDFVSQSVSDEEIDAFIGSMPDSAQLIGEVYMLASRLQIACNRVYHNVPTREEKRS